jgi:pyrroline-5-carboxylate reductase
MTKLAVIGAGNMGGAIISGAINSKFLTSSDVTVCDMNEEKLEKYNREGFPTTVNPSEAAAMSEVLLIAVKPQQIDSLFEAASPYCDGKLIISIAAGVTISRIEGSLPGCRVIRVMPNTPLIVGKGVSALCRGNNVSDSDYAFANGIFSSAGITLEADESLLNPMTALTSSAVAYFARFIDDMCVWAKDNGFGDMEDDTLYSIVADTAAGTAGLISEAGMSPRALERAVTSPNGTTERAMAVFTDEGLTDTVSKAMTACLKRANELSGI